MEIYDNPLVNSASRRLALNHGKGKLTHFHSWNRERVVQNSLDEHQLRKNTRKCPYYEQNVAAFDASFSGSPSHS